VTLDEVDQLMSTGPLVLAVCVSILAGFVSFASPCVVPLVPGYLSYLAAVVGVEAHDAEDGGADGARVAVRAARFQAATVSVKSTRLTTCGRADSDAPAATTQTPAATAAGSRSPYRRQRKNTATMRTR